MENLISPFLIRVFVNEKKHKKKHNREGQYREDRNEVPDSPEFQVHVWMTTTLNDISHMIVSQFYTDQETKPLRLRQFSRMSFKVVFTNSEAKTVMRDLGIVEIFTKEKDKNKTLGALKVRPGDHLDVCLLPRIKK